MAIPRQQIYIISQVIPSQRRPIIIPDVLNAIIFAQALYYVVWKVFFLKKINVHSSLWNGGDIYGQTSTAFTDPIFYQKKRNGLITLSTTNLIYKFMVFSLGLWKNMFYSNYLNDRIWKKKGYWEFKLDYPNEYDMNGIIE